MALLRLLHRRCEGMRIFWAFIFFMFICEYCGDHEPSAHALKTHERRRCSVKRSRKDTILALRAGRSQPPRNTNSLHAHFQQMEEFDSVRHNLLFSYFVLLIDWSAAGHLRGQTRMTAVLPDRGRALATHKSAKQIWCVTSFRSSILVYKFALAWSPAASG